MPSSYLSYTLATCITESLLGIFFFPGLAAFDERYGVESLVAWGIGQTINNYAAGFVSVMGPVTVLISGLIVGIRERHFYKGRKAVNEDQRKFNEAWVRVQQEEGATEALEQLQQLERNFKRAHRMQMQPGHASAHVSSSSYTMQDNAFRLSAVMPAPSLPASSPSLPASSPRTWLHGASCRTENRQSGWISPPTPELPTPRAPTEVQRTSHDVDDLDLEANGGTRFQDDASSSSIFGSTASSVATLSLDQLCAQAVVVQVNEYIYL